MTAISMVLDAGSIYLILAKAICERDLLVGNETPDENYSIFLPPKYLFLNRNLFLRKPY